MRRQELFAKMQINDVVVLFAHPVYYRSNDVNFHFRQNSDFWYLTGFPEQDAIAVLYKHVDGEEFWLFCQEQDPHLERWNGKIIGPVSAKNNYLATKTFTLADFNLGMKILLNPHALQQTNVTDGAQLRELFFSKHENGYITALTKLQADWGADCDINILDYRSLLTSQRMVKETAEINLIQQAVDISVGAHLQVMQNVCPNLYEYEVAAIFAYELQRRNCQHAYPSIVAGGENGCVLHYIINDSVLKDGDLLLIDAGSEYQNYASDITRTIPVNGTFSKEQALVYQVVLNAQETAIAAIKPGVAWQAIADLIVTELTTGLLELGLLTGTVVENIAQKNYLQFYPHSYGHMLGLDVHDSCKKMDAELLLEPGMVFTVEPGIYISRELTTVENRWHGIAVRIEDNVVVTDDGCKVLSAALPKEIAKIEHIMQQQNN